MDKFVLKYESNNEWLAHHGILGQKWGVRRFQNKDGSLKAAGKKRYGSKEGAAEDAVGYKYNKPGESGWTGAKRAISEKRYARATKKVDKTTDRNLKKLDASLERVEQLREKSNNRILNKMERRMDKLENQNKGDSIGTDKKLDRLATRYKANDQYLADVKLGHKIMSDSYRTSGDLYKKSIKDPSIKKSAAYKNANGLINDYLDASKVVGSGYALSLVGESARLNKNSKR